MRIAGEWHVCDDGVMRPILRIVVQMEDLAAQSDLFLIDSGADRTVFSADLFRKMEMRGAPPPLGLGLFGISGGTDFVLVRAALELTEAGGRPVTVRGEFAAFKDPSATDLSILGRDVLDNFDVILSRGRNEVLLLAPNHTYRVVPS